MLSCFIPKRLFRKRLDIEVLNGFIIKLQPFKTYIIESVNSDLLEEIYTVKISYCAYEITIRVNEENLTKIKSAKIDL
ncbi:hypothetical protein OHW31_13415 [Acinetobacter baumannii]|nr:hypothetical protein [Acinetobacter baumannii]